MGLREAVEAAQAQQAEKLSERARALGDRLEQGETPVASSAGDLVLKEPLPPQGSSVDEAMAHFPTPDGDFVLTDRTLYYRDPRGNVYLLRLASITRWRQKRSDQHPHLPSYLQRRILEIEVTMSDGGRYLIESGKVFARQIRKTGKIRRRRR
jgi:hypothetical protein